MYLVSWLAFFLQRIPHRENGQLGRLAQQYLLWEYVGSTLRTKRFMAISTAEQPKNRRFQLRTSAREETLIKVAAERQGVNVTDFILSAAREKAQETLADQSS